MAASAVSVSQMKPSAVSPTDTPLTRLCTTIDEHLTPADSPQCRLQHVVYQYITETPPPSSPPFKQLHVSSEELANGLIITLRNC